MTPSTHSTRTVGLLFGAYAVSQSYIAALLYPLGLDVLRLQTTGDPDELRHIVSTWTPEQIAQYREHLLPDTLHPFLYGSALAAAGIAGHQPATGRWVRTAAVAAPALAALCDLAENAFHAKFLRHPKQVKRAEARISILFTRTKWILACSSAAALIIRSLRNR